MSFIRPAPAAYDRKDQQDVRNEIARISKDNQRPQEEFYMTDRVDGKVYRLTLESGAWVITAT